MAGFVQPIIQGLTVLQEHKAKLAAQAQAQAEQQQRDLQQAVIQMVMQRMQGGQQ